MTDTKIKDTTNKATVAGTDQIPINDVAGGNLDKMVTVDGIKTYVKTGLAVADITDLTATATEVNYTTDVTSLIQAQLDVKQTTTLADAKILVGNGSNVATAVTPTGEVLISNAGVTSFDKIQKVIKQTIETVASDSTLSNDAELFFTVKANKTYAGLVNIFTTSNTTADFKYAFTLPSGATGNRSNGTMSSNVNQGTADITSTATVAITTTNMVCLSIFFHIVTSSTPGTVNFQWAQATLDASNTSVNIGSSIMVWEV